MVELDYIESKTRKLKIDMTQFPPEQPYIFDFPQPFKVSQIRVTRKEGLELEVEFL